MIRRLRAHAERALRCRERFVYDDASRLDRSGERGKQITLQIACYQHRVESRGRQWMLREIGAPAAEAQSLARGLMRRLHNRIDVDIDPKHVEASARER